MVKLLVSLVPSPAKGQPQLQNGLGYCLQKSAAIAFQTSTLTQNVAGPVIPAPPRIYWSCKIITGPTHFSWTSQEKHCIKFNNNIYIYYFIFIYFENIWGHMRGNLWTRMSSNVYWPCIIGLRSFLLAQIQFGELGPAVRWQCQYLHLHPWSLRCCYCKGCLK